MSRDAESMLFSCPEHNFITNARSDGELTCRGSPGHRVTGCESCDKAVADAFAFAGWNDE